MLIENEQLGLKMKKEPDGLVQSRAPINPDQRPATLMAFECAVWNESVDELAKEVTQWHDGGVSGL